MNKLAVLLSCISSIGNSIIVYKLSSYNPEIMELNIFFSCVFAVINIYGIYKETERDELTTIDTSNEPTDAPGDNLGRYITVDTTSSMFLLPTDEVNNLF